MAKPTLLSRYGAIVSALLVIACTSCSSDSDNGQNLLPEMLKKTAFPQGAVEDYDPVGHQARVAFPGPRGGPRVWVKGSATYPTCEIGKTTYELPPPNFTRLIDVSSSQVEIQFYSAKGGVSKSLTLHPKSDNEIIRNDDFSVLVYGCFQPFHVDPESGQPVVRQDTMSNNLLIREAFRDIALSHLQNDARESILPPTIAVLGTGDQVYVDAAYYTSVSPNPMSAWSTGDKPLPMLNDAAFVEHLNALYAAFGSFKTLNAITDHIPVLSVWDDHEIRDGWGSQGDEYVDSLNGYEYLNPRFAPYFMAARRAFTDHQWSLGPGSTSTPPQNIPSEFHQETVLGDMPVFALDTRSSRNILTNTVISSEQLQALNIWLENLDNGETAVIVSSVPLFIETPDVLKTMVGVAAASLEDDLTDAWGSATNIDQRNELFQSLIRFGEDKSLNFIFLSGDIHVGAIIEVWVERSDRSAKTLLGYEMIASGLSHKDLADQSWSTVLAGQIGKDGVLTSDLPYPGIEGTTLKVTSRTQATAAKLNFGAISKSQGQRALHLFFKDSDQFEHIRVQLAFDRDPADTSVNINEVSGENTATTYHNQSDLIQRTVIPR